MKAWKVMLGAMVFAFGIGVACAQNPVLGRIEAPYANVQGTVTIANIQWGPGAVAYGPVGTPLVITGYDLGFSGTVQFIAYKNGAVDTNVSPVTATATAWTSEMLMLTVPSGAMSGLVKVTTNVGTSNGLPFMVTPGSYAGSCSAVPTTNPLQILTTVLTDGNAGQAYSFPLKATGGTGADTWSITSGTLPSGLTLTSSGVISGTPTAASSPVNLTVQVNDSSSPAQHDEAVLSLNILSPSIAPSNPVTVYDFCVPGPWNSNTNPNCGTTPSGYDPVGDLTSYSDTAYASNGSTVVDSVMGTWNFTYDSLNRLATAGAAWPSQTQQPYSNACWNYDSFGNRKQQEMSSAAFTSGSGGATACTTQGLVATSLASYNSNNQIVSTNASGVSVTPGYDTAGNLTYDGVNYYSYDAEGRICAMQSTPAPGFTAAYGYLYDADGTRVAKGTITASPNPVSQPLSCDPTTNGFQFTENYVLGPGGEELTMLNGSNVWQRTNVYAGGKLVATYDMVDNPAFVDGGSQPVQIPALHFHIEDPLGSRRMQLGGNLAYNGQPATLGQPETDIQSLPFGDGQNSFPDQYAPTTADDSTPLHFTGKERDAESGNDYFGARYYASTMGRFMSPDWSAKEEPVPYAQMDDPQSLNLYGYVRNNPLTRADADGHDPFTLTAAWGAIQTGATAVETGLVAGASATMAVVVGVGAQIFAPPMAGQPGETAITNNLNKQEAAREQGSPHAPGDVPAPANTGNPHAPGDVPNDQVVVRGGTIPPPSSGTWSGAQGATIEEAGKGVPNGQVQPSTGGQIRAAGGEVRPAPEPPYPGAPVNGQHVSVTGGQSSFGPPRTNPAPKPDRVVTRPQN